MRIGIGMGVSARPGGAGGGGAAPVVRPNFTGPTTDGWTADAQSELSATYPAWKAFDGNRTTLAGSWVSQSASGLEQWVRLQSPTPVKLVGYALTASPSGGGQYFPVNWRIEGSNDGVNWTAVDTRSNQATWANLESRSFVPSSSATAYLQYRFYAPLVAGGAINDGRQVYLCEWDTTFTA